MFDIGKVLNLHPIGNLAAHLGDIWEVKRKLFYVQISVFVQNVVYQYERLKKEYEKVEGYRTFYYDFQGKSLKMGKINIY